MKKTRFLVLALAVAIMMMGAGYAWWSETVVISTEVNTGYLDVDVVGQSANTYSISYPYGNRHEALDNVYATASLNPIQNTDANGDNDNDTLTVTFDNMYPASKGVATFDILNNSTMAVKLANIMDASLVGDLKNVDVTVTPKFVNDNPGYLNPDGPITLVPHYANGNLDYYSMPGEWADLFFVKGDKLEVTITVDVDKDLGDAFEKKSLTCTINPEFVQFNN